MNKFQTNNYQSEIIADIRNAKQSIKVAVSWLTDQLLINELLAARRRGIEVKIVMSSNEYNILRFELFQKLIDIGAEVRKWGTENPDVSPFMHLKIYIIDDKFAKSGSYNWSIAASTNAEALDPVDVTTKLTQFTTIYDSNICYNFFHEIENPELKRAELESIERQQKDILTPEKLAAYRQIQVALKEQDIRHKKEIQGMEQQKKEAEMREAEQKEKEQVAIQRAKEAEKLAADLKLKEIERQKQITFQEKEVKIPVTPPTRYA